eukprot:CAMPEP_0174306422 /NCGR_PEP_ID=MMETSP0810-20121108/441_1 /TAXON_ID=73025 ORGANISM="Eutreptiella gymnastica-like, Strain CCMP1594" /NCGR_SAMPLE_ID=MMETSP0810 /ASSEMBLY_ACC=CAM_ASM_000659 /LENGTH=101 /DNA_ID=CAMNT_0015413133 /DNA_START=259 /DNA_END=561 /DNA_ORIENTATION=+
MEKHMKARSSCVQGCGAPVQERMFQERPRIRNREIAKLDHRAAKVSTDLPLMAKGGGLPRHHPHRAASSDLLLGPGGGNPALCRPSLRGNATQSTATPAGW